MIPEALQRYVNFGLRSLLPKTRTGDRIFQTLYFMMRHNRLPGRHVSMADALHHIKISDESLRPERTFTSCKYLVKDYVAAKVGREYTVPTIAVLQSKDEIDAFDFPANCCIKSTHGSGHIIIRHKGTEIDRGILKGWLDINYYDKFREASYRYLKPCVIVEPLIFGGEPVRDYKIFCVDGEPRMIQVDCDRETKHTRVLFDCNWNRQPFGLKYPLHAGPIERPENLDEMLDVAARVSRDFSFVRIDFYTSGTECMIGEITHCHGSGGERFHPAEGEWIAAELLFGRAG